MRGASFSSAEADTCNGTKFGVFEKHLKDIKVDGTDFEESQVFSDEESVKIKYKIYDYSNDIEKDTLLIFKK